MATTGQNVSRHEFQRRIKEVFSTGGARLGQHSADKLAKAVAGCSATDPDLGSDWQTLIEANLTSNYRVGPYNREHFEVLHAAALASAAVHSFAVSVTTAGSSVLGEGYYDVTAFTGGTGTLGTLNVFVDANGEVTSVGMTGGSGYLAADVLTITEIGGITQTTNATVTVA